MKNFRVREMLTDQPIFVKHMLEFEVGRRLVRLWVRDTFQAPYAFSDYGPTCFGFAWFGAMVFPPRS